MLFENESKDGNYKLVGFENKSFHSKNDNKYLKNQGESSTDQ